MERQRDKGLKGALKRVVMICALLSAAYFLLNSSVDRYLSIDTIVYGQSLDENSASGKAFLAAFPVFQHPRCVNCHPADDAPLIGDASLPHPMRIRRGPEGMGEDGVFCSTCHQSTNLSGVHMPPGAPAGNSRQKIRRWLLKRGRHGSYVCSSRIPHRTEKERPDKSSSTFGMRQLCCGGGIRAMAEHPSQWLTMYL